MIDKWNKRFLDMAALVATWSKDPATQVGAVIVDAQSRIISTGFNGLAQNVHDLPSRYENKHVKHQIILHAESNAILFARQSLTGCTIYTAPLATCAHCASQIIQTGIARVVCRKDKVSEKWEQSAILARQMYEEAGVIFEELEVRD